MKKLAIFSTLLAATLLFAACSAPTSDVELSNLQPQRQTQKETIMALENLPTAITELKTEDIVVGTGDVASEGAEVTVHYTGYLLDGTMFQSSKDSGRPFTFILGLGEVIPGWEVGVQGMKVGGTRRLYLPPEMAYGPRAVGNIPANSALIFDVELLGVQQ